ncbi:tRNA lysidine(34) synthetase TilS [uncultured Sphingomonas sp.]|uniref:tRNA lysidine(34) synthetase TilS n=1 Tax=uncultured Sphingomonas sp. TaxID=158754 RepID=UPI0035C9CEAD
MSPISADRLDPALVARFRADLAQLCDPDAARILVAVSGGGDSLALLLLAHAALGDRCHAATVDHRIRPEAADEAAGVGRLCAARGIDHHVLADDLPARAGRTANVSARARALRYRLLEAHATAIGADRLATAHHADDQLETLVMRLNRGAGLAGLAGIRAAGGMIIRPLLGWRRAELAALLAGCGIVAIDDPSNVSDRYDRARLRKALVGTDWLDVGRVAASARALGEAEDALAWATREAERRHCDGPDARGPVTLYPAGLPVEIRRRLVVTCLTRVDDALDLRGPEIARLIAALAGGGAATLGEVLARATTRLRYGVETPAWVFVKAPARRS